MPNPTYGTRYTIPLQYFIVTAQQLILDNEKKIQLKKKKKKIERAINEFKGTDSVNF